MPVAATVIWAHLKVASLALWQVVFWCASGATGPVRHCRTGVFSFSSGADIKTPNNKIYNILDAFHECGKLVCVCAVINAESIGKSTKKGRAGKKGDPANLEEQYVQEQKAQEDKLQGYYLGRHNLPIYNCDLVHTHLAVRPINDNQVHELVKTLMVGIANNYPLSVYIWGTKNEQGQTLVKKDGGQWKVNWSNVDQSKNVHVSVVIIV